MIDNSCMNEQETEDVGRFTLFLTFTCQHKFQNNTKYGFERPYHYRIVHNILLFR